MVEILFARKSEVDDLDAAVDALDARIDALEATIVTGALRFDIAQSLTTGQKVQAFSNLGITPVAFGQVLASNGVGAAPVWTGAPTLTTSLTVPRILGGTAPGSSLVLVSTSGVGVGADGVHIAVGNNGDHTVFSFQQNVLTQQQRIKYANNVPIYDYGVTSDNIAASYFIQLPGGIVVPNGKNLYGIRFSQVDGDYNTFTIGTGSTAAAFNGYIRADAASAADTTGAAVYLLIGTAATQGAAAAKAVYGRATGLGGSATGPLFALVGGIDLSTVSNAFSSVIQADMTGGANDRGNWAFLDVSTSTGCGGHKCRLANGFFSQYAIPFLNAWAAIWMDTVNSDPNARAVQLRVDAGTEIAYLKITGEFFSTTGLIAGATEANAVKITTAAVTRTAAAGNISIVAGTDANTNVTLQASGVNMAQVFSDRLELGVVAANVGKIAFRNLTSGTQTLQPAVGALGTSTLTLPNVTDTLAHLTTPTFITNITVPRIIGGTAPGQQLAFQTTSGVGSGDTFGWFGGNNGATTFMSLQASGLTVPTTVLSGNIGVTGTAGGGYVTYQGQSSTPSTPGGTNLRIFSNSVGELAWIKPDGFVRSFASTLTANRIYTLPNATGEMLMSQRLAWNGAGGNLDISSTPYVYIIQQTATDILAARQITLPTAANFGAGRELIIIDQGQGATDVKTISLALSGGDTLNRIAATQVAINSPGGYVGLVSDGVSDWTTERVSASAPAGLLLPPIIIRGANETGTYTDSTGQVRRPTLVAARTVTSMNVQPIVYVVDITYDNGTAAQSAQGFAVFGTIPSSNSTAHNSFVGFNFNWNHNGSGTLTTLTGTQVQANVGGTGTVTNSVVSQLFARNTGGATIGTAGTEGVAFLRLFQPQGPTTAVTSTWRNIFGIDILDMNPTASGGGANTLTNPPIAINIAAQTASGAFAIKTSTGLISFGDIATITKTGNTVQLLTLSANAAPVAVPTDTAAVIVAAADSKIASFIADSYLGAPAFSGRASAGTQASKSAVVNTSILVGLGGSGWDGAAYVSGGGVQVRATETWSNSGPAHGSLVAVRAFSVGAGGAIADVAIFHGSGGFAVNTASDPGAGMIYTNSASFMIRTKTSYSNGAGASTGTLTNAPAATNPTKWIPVDDNGTTRYIPAW